MTNPLPPCSANATDIAIVGMACRFPGASTLDQFWDNLRNGVVSVSHFDVEELRAAGVAEADLTNPDYVRTASRLENAEDFDADYFNFSPVEANFIDPQQRIFLECSVEALEDAGCDPKRFNGEIGVFAGCALNVRHLSRALDQFDETLGEPQLFTILANDKDYIATRLSYKLDLSGPSINLQAACSTSLVGVHLACQSLLNGECDAAIAGGASVVFSYAKMGYRFSEGSVFSSDGVCRPFDADASGTVFGDGVGVVLLKRYADAVADGDNIRAVIKGSALNNDGSRKASFAAPSMTGQAGVVSEAIAMAGIPAETIGYVEAHGTGTAIGDPIEIEGLKRVFKAAPEGERCAIGSVKGNIGHLNAAAGVAGLIKTVLSLENDEIPPTANFAKLNPKIDFSNTPFFVNDRTVPWSEVSSHRRAGISSFGIGGTNSHVIVEAAPLRERTGQRKARKSVFLLTAKTEAALGELAHSYSNFLLENPQINLDDLAHTLTEGRARHAHGVAVIGTEIGTIAAAFEKRSTQNVVQGRVLGDAPRLAMVFPGQGSQCVSMGQRIYRREPVYREEFDRCLAILLEKHGLDLAPILLPVDDEKPAPSELLDRTDYAQPAIFATSFALAKLWLSWGVTPDALAGHSLGELVAACIAGVFSLEDALGLVVKRGELMNAAETGAMLAVIAEPESLSDALLPELSIASFNGPVACVVAGPFGAIDAFQKHLSARGIVHTRLRTSHAFHTASMNEAVGPFVEAVKAVERHAPSIPFISNVTGTWITEEEAVSPQYWGDHILQPVQFARGIATLTEGFEGVLLEVGPGSQLSGLLTQLVDDTKQTIVTSMPRPGRDHDEVEKLLCAVAGVGLAGIQVDWTRVNGTEDARKISLPTYPFQRRTYGLGASTAQTTRPSKQVRDITLTQDHSVKFYEPYWKRVRPSQETNKTPRRWLVFGNGKTFDKRLCEALSAAGDDVITVSRAAKFCAHHPDRYSLNPHCAGDSEALVGELEKCGKIPDGIIYAWMLEADECAEAKVETAYFKVTRLVSQIKALDFSSQHDVFLLTANAHDVFGEMRARPSGTALVGLARSLTEEFDALSVNCIDLVASDLHEPFAELAVESIKTAIAVDCPRIIALRNSRWFTPRLEQLPVKDCTESQDNLLSQATWLITGGLGGIGLALADGLVQRGAKKLALVGRRFVPPRSEWNDCLADDGPRASALRAILELEAKGAQIEILTADVADELELCDAFTRAREVFGRIDAVLHCAGVVDGGLAATKSNEIAKRVLRPKVDGTLCIERAVGDDPLQLFVLCSSITTILNNPGQTDYATANSFLDGFATSGTRCAKKVISINWDSWSEVGMAAGYAVPEAFRDERDAWLESGLKTQEGVEAFFKAIASDVSRVVVTKLGLDGEDKLIQLAPRQSGPQKSDTIHPRPELGVPYAAPRSDFEASAAAIMAEMLNLEMVGIDDNFLDLGCHSLTATRFAAKVREETGVVVPLANLFEGLTLRSTVDSLEIDEWEEGVI